jgi:two-component system sensor kinase FixL
MSAQDTIRPLVVGLQPGRLLTAANRLAVALALVAVAFAVRWALDPFLLDGSPFHIFALAVLLAAIFGGAGPGLLATFLSAALANVFFLTPRGTPSLAWPALLETFFFMVTSGAIVWIAELLRRARRERLKAHDELAAREALLRSVLDTVPDAMVVIDDKGIMQSFSSAAERLFGYRAAEVVGRNVSMLMPAPYSEQHDGYIARYLRTGERRIIGVGRVVVAQRKDGTAFPIELSVGEVHVIGRRLFTGFIRDLTERQERENRLQEIHNELIHISRLSEMGQMASTIAHEINQPLAAVNNYINASLRLLESDRPDAIEKAKEIAQKAGDQTFRAAKIIQRLRLFLRKGETERRAEPIRRLIEEASALALIGAKSRDVDARFDFPDDVYPVVVDRVQIQQVLVNLIRNAVEAMSGHPVRRVTVSFRPRADGMLEVAVIDTGPGLPGIVKERLFEPFVTTKTHGMGIGLSICRSIVQAHGGELWAEANPAGGTVFRFSLPMAGADGA